jgi:hypothetical protein
MLGLVVAIELAIAGHDREYTTPMHWDWRVLGKAAKRTKRVQDRQILLFGDSLVKFSLMPSILEEGSGKKVYNFALHTGQTSSSYFMLRRALKAGAKPSAVVLDLTPHMFMGAPQVNQHLWAELLSPLECYDLSLTMRDPDFFASIMLAELLPSYKDRHEIRAGIMASVQGLKSSRRDQIMVCQRNWRLNDGAQLMSDSPAPAINIDEWVNTLYSSWSPNPVNVSYLDRFLELAKSHQIQVYWLLPPIHPVVQARTDASGFDASYSDFTRQVQSRFPGTIVVDARHAGFVAEEFMDGVHLDREGALKLSAALGEVLREPAVANDTARWVALDARRTRTVSLRLEDVSQSAEYFQDKQKKRQRQ